MARTSKPWIAPRSGGYSAIGTVAKPKPPRGKGAASKPLIFAIIQHCAGCTCEHEGA